MNSNIIADSCCDLTPELRKQLEVASVPLSLTLGEESFTDDDTLDLPAFMERMKNYNGRIGSACPAPLLYKEAFESSKTSYAVTLSSNLSGSYESAMLGKTLAEEEGADVHVFDSKSASAGEVLIVCKIRELLSGGIDKPGIITMVEKMISEMKTFFVIENLDNLMKNGRLNKITGKILSMLHIKPIMGSDGDGNIALFSQARGEAQTLEKLIDTIEKDGRPTEDRRIVITHCNNPGLAGKLMEAIKNRYHFKDILILPTRGISSMYVNDRGVIMAF